MLPRQSGRALLSTLIIAALFAFGAMRGHAQAALLMEEPYATRGSPDMTGLPSRSSPISTQLKTHRRCRPGRCLQR
jgi:hypothetical protein